MEKRIQLGKISLGTSTFGREISEKSAFELLDYAYEFGIRTLDTAEMYGGGNAFKIRQERFQTSDVREVSLEMSSSEKIIGRWLYQNGCRDEMTLMSKVSSGNSPSNIYKRITASLENLQTNRLDIYQVHRPDEAVPIEETLSALSDLKDSGLARSIGCSNFNQVQLCEALHVSDELALARFEYIQLPYNLVQREFLKTILATCLKENVRILVYSPLGAGFLTGKYRSDQHIPGNTRFDISPTHREIYFSQKNFEIVEKLSCLASKTGIAMPLLAMAWTLSNPHTTSTLIGARKIGHIESALEAVQLMEDSYLMQQMDELV